MNEILISIIVPIYNVEKYITHCMKSICNQSFKNFEVILVDDGSPDNATSIADGILSEEKIEFRMIRQANKGVSAARNVGIRQAKGKWVVCVDPDDVICKDFLKVVDGCELPILMANYKMVTKENLFEEPKEVLEGEVIEKEEALKGFLTRKLRIISPAIFIKKDFLVDHNLYYDEKTRFSEDVCYIWRILFLTDYILYINSPLYNYFLRANSTMTSSGYTKIVTGYDGMQKVCNEFFESYPEIVKLMMPRWVLGALRSSSRILSKEAFFELTQKFELKKHLPYMLKFPEIKARMLAVVLIVSKNLFYFIARL